MSEGSDFVSKVVGAASQGAVGAVVAASLSAVTEPVVNRVLVKRIPLMQAISEVDSSGVWRMLKTTMSTNFIKFPFFEAVNVIMTGVAVPPWARGSVTGAVFCTITLPITNYRYRKSMDLEISGIDVLYQAYLPTVLRDVIYGIVRNKVGAELFNRNKEWSNTNAGRFSNMFLTVLCSCVLSAPGNEIRAYTLQPPPRMAFGEFFKPEKFVRATSIGSVIMAISLGMGTLATPKVQKLFDMLKKYLRENPLAYALFVLFMMYQFQARQRHQEQLQAVKDSAAAARK